MDLNTLVEIAATVAGLIYIVLMIRENIACWPFGIAGSILSIYLFVDGRLYSEALLYSYYVIVGIWGWLRWHQRQQTQDNPVVHNSLPQHLLLSFVSAAAAIALGYVFATYSDAQRPYIDAFTTCFSFAATYLEVKKVLETWYYWIVLNTASIWLYQERGLDIYAALIGVYAVLSVVGLLRWQRAYRDYQSATP